MYIFIVNLFLGVLINNIIFIFVNQTLIVMNLIIPL